MKKDSCVLKWHCVHSSLSSKGCPLDKLLRNAGIHIIRFILVPIYQSTPPHIAKTWIYIMQIPYTVAWLPSRWWKQAPPTRWYLYPSHRYHNLKSPNSQNGLHSGHVQREMHIFAVLLRLAYQWKLCGTSTPTRIGTGNNHLLHTSKAQTPSCTHNARSVTNCRFSHIPHTTVHAALLHSICHWRTTIYHGWNTDISTPLTIHVDIMSCSPSSHKFKHTFNC